MTQEAGWVEVLDRESARVLARGHLRVDEFELAEGSWCGHLDSIHPAPGAAALAAGGYALGFGRPPDQRLVRLEVARNGIRVCGEDGLLPAALTERSEGT